LSVIIPSVAFYLLLNWLYLVIVVILSVVAQLNVVMLSVIMFNFSIPYAIMLSVAVAALTPQKKPLNAVFVYRI
jgi:hypothetical protein